MERHSAILDLGSSEIRIPCINANHSTVCKFAVEDESYREVIDEIETLISWAMSISIVLETNSSQSYEIAQSLHGNDNSSGPGNSLLNREFFAPTSSHDDDAVSIATSVALRRPLETNRKVRRGPFFLVPLPRNLGFVGQRLILHRLKGFATSTDTSKNKMALCGLGGIGKSQIALEHAFWYKMNNPDHSVSGFELEIPTSCNTL